MKKLKGNKYGKGNKAQVIFNLLLLYLLLVTPAHALSPVDLSKEFAFGGITSLGQGLTYLVTPAFSIAGLAVFLFLIIGAFRFITSGGDKQALEGARNMIVHAIIGFVLLMLMFLIIEFIPPYFGFTGLQIIK